jgi:hypothetical protein
MQWPVVCAQMHTSLTAELLPTRDLYRGTRNSENQLMAGGGSSLFEPLRTRRSLPLACCWLNGSSMGWLATGTGLRRHPYSGVTSREPGEPESFTFCAASSNCGPLAHFGSTALPAFVMA